MDAAVLGDVLARRRARTGRKGSRQVVINVGHGLRIGPMVLFETAFPDMTRHLAEDGADVLVGQSSTSSFQRSWAPEQHASLAALRAAETGRPMVHATLTGVSAVYDASGRRVGSSARDRQQRRPGVRRAAGEGRHTVRPSRRLAGARGAVGARRVGRHRGGADAADQTPRS
ncbi:Apolipoprotein N-acyltransferase [Streptomyces alboniger]